MELLSPAGSYEGVLAAVSNGADAIYTGLGDFNARRNAKNLSNEEFLQAVRYCHIRGVKVYVTLNTLMSDRELVQAREIVSFIYNAGADAVLVQDLGTLELVRSLAPGLSVHASTQMSVHSLDGVNAASKLGARRVVLARELSRENIAHICGSTGTEVEVFIHGALCMCYSGQCYMSACIGGRSGNRGLCAQPCRLGYGFDGKADGYPLSLKDLTLSEHLCELKDLGVSCVKIEGRMKRPEYSAIVTRVFAQALKENRNPSHSDIEVLRSVFSREGFTDAYYKDDISAGMFGVRGEAPVSRETAAMFKAAKAEYTAGREVPRATVEFFCEIAAGVPAKLTVTDGEGNSATVTGDIPEPSHTKPLVSAAVNTQLYKTGGTHYTCGMARSRVAPDVTLPLSAINALRRAALDALSALRGRQETRELGKFPPPVTGKSEHTGKPDIILQVTRLKQLTPVMLSGGVSRVYVPLTEIAEHRTSWPDMLRKTQVAAVLPRVIQDGERDAVISMLETAQKLGIGEAVAGNLGHISMAQNLGFTVRGDFGLNAFNASALRTLGGMGLISATLSFELGFSQIRDMPKPLDCEIIAFGRLPLMVTENCIIKNKFGKCLCEDSHSISDRKSMFFPVMREFDHRNVIYNSNKLFLADKREDYEHLGLAAIRLLLTTETPVEALSVVESYTKGGNYQPNVLTRGLYYRGVE